MPEACIAPSDLRELRELVRHRRQLVQPATAVTAGIRALLAKHNIQLPATQLESDTATGMLDALELPGTYAIRRTSQRRLIVVLADEFAATEVKAAPPGAGAPRLPEPAHGQRHRATLAAVFVAEIGDVTRSPTAGAPCCWAGLTPRHYEPDTTVRRGHISKEGEPLVRWDAVEAIQR